MLASEQWAVIGNGPYWVSDFGRIRRRVQRGWKFLTGSPDSYGYRIVKLRLHDGKSHLVHKLVTHAFLGLRPPGYQVNHRNGIRDDNRLSNLEYVTASENVQHAFAVLGKTSAHRGESTPGSKLTANDVREIRRRRKEGEGKVSLSLAFGISPSNVYQICSRRTWKHI